METTNITITQLKAAAYDAIAQVQIWQKQLEALNEQIKNYVEPVMEQVVQLPVNGENGVNKQRNKQRST